MSAARARCRDGAFGSRVVVFVAAALGLGGLITSTTPMAAVVVAERASATTSSGAGLVHAATDGERARTVRASDDGWRAGHGGVAGSAGRGNPPDPMARVEGPVEGGQRTGKPWNASRVDPSEFGYVEEEYLLSGVASNLGPDPVQFSPYTTRMLVLRPADMRGFNGTVVMEWTNVSGQVDASVLWALMHRYAAPNGYVFAAVAAQKAGVDGGPQAMKDWDPQRYDKLTHPGDVYSFDIFTQAAQALARPSGPLPFFARGAHVKAVVAGGVSQGCSRLIRYIDLVEPTTHVIDGFVPIGCRNALAHPDLVPVLWVNSEYESRGNVMPPDGDLLRVWEIAGASHFGWWGLNWSAGAAVRDEANVGGTTTVNPPWDPDLNGQYGERGSGPCPQNFFPDRYVHDSALHNLNEWVRTGTPPPTARRLDRDANNNLIQDEYGNVIGGLRLPVVDVPVASYRTDICPEGSVLMGMSIAFDPVTLQSLYGDGSYVPKMQAATDKAVAEGFMVPEDAADLVQRARASSIGVQ